jgi:hypothetical protein
VGFKPLSVEGRLTLFKRYFPEVELTIEAAERWRGWTASRRGTSRR